MFLEAKIPDYLKNIIEDMEQEGQAPFVSKIWQKSTKMKQKESVPLVPERFKIKWIKWDYRNT